MSDAVETLAPSAGVESQPIAPPTITAADEQIAQPVEGQPVGETPSTEALEAQPEETEVDLDATPETSGDFEAYKPLFKEHPELRNILGREKAFSEIAPNGSFRELKGIVERIPTLDDAEVLSSQAESHRVFGETFRTDPVGFTEYLRENDPLAFSQFATKLPEILAQTAPNLYSEQARYYSNAVLDNLFMSAQRSGDEQAILSVQNVARMLGAQLGMARNAAPAGNSELERLKQQIAQRDQQDTQAKAASFWDGANSEYTTNATNEIEALIKKSIPTVTDAQLKRMGSEVWEGVNSRLSLQPQTTAQIQRFKSDVAKGKTGVADHRAIVDFSTGRAKKLIPLVWKEVSADWTKNIVSASKEQIEKKKGIAATTREVSSGAQQTSNTGAPAMRTSDSGKKKSFASVFNSLKSGNYQPARPNL